MIPNVCAAYLETPNPHMHMTIRVAIVEDAEAFRKGIAAMLDATDGFECVAKYADAENAVTHLLKQKPDVVLMDIGLPKMSGIDALRTLKAAAPHVQYLMLTVFEDDEKIFQALQAGASGYLLKNTPSEKILEAICDVKNGGSAMSPQVARRVIDFFRHAPQPNEICESAKATFELTDREWEILQLLAKGYTYKDIGEKLPQKISPHTVRTHIHRIYEKMHVRNRAEAVQKAQRQKRL